MMVAAARGGAGRPRRLDGGRRHRLHARGHRGPELDRAGRGAGLADPRGQCAGAVSPTWRDCLHPVGALLLPAGAVGGDGARPQLRPGDAHALAQRDRADGGRRVLPPRSRGAPDRRGGGLHRQPVRAGEPARSRRLQPRPVRLRGAPAPLRPAERGDGPPGRGRLPAAGAPRAGRRAAWNSWPARSATGWAGRCPEHQPRSGADWRPRGTAWVADVGIGVLATQHAGAALAGRRHRPGHGAHRLELRQPAGLLRPEGGSDRRARARHPAAAGTSARRPEAAHSR